MRSRLSIALTILAISFLAAATSVVFRSLSEALREEYGFSALQYGLIFSVGTAPGILAGPLADVRGARPVILIGAVAGAMGLLLLSVAPAMPFIIAGGILTTASLSFTAGVVLRVLAAHWFVRWRGAMLGLLIAVPGLTSILSSSVRIAPGDAWRTATGVTALAALAIAVLAILVLRSHPEEDQEESPIEGLGPRRRSPRWERRLPSSAYLRNGQLWTAILVLGVGAALVQGTRTSLSFFLPSILFPLGVSLADLPHTAVTYGAVAGGLTLGIAADLLGYRRPLVVGGLVGISGLAFLALAPSVAPLIVLSLLLVGFGTGGVGALITLRFVDAVGVRLLGTLSLVFAFIQGLGNPFILPLFGQLQDNGELPTPAWSGLLGVFLLAGMLAAMAAPFPDLEKKLRDIPAERVG